MIEVGRRDLAPSADAARHDVYLFAIDPHGSPRPFRFEQSIGGGHAERGGCADLALDELESWPGLWREHLARAGCRWVIPLLEAAQVSGDAPTAVAAIAARAAARRPA